MKTVSKIVQGTALVALLLIIIGTVTWANRTLPYEGDLANATLRHLHRIDFRNEEKTLAQIYDVQTECEQLAARQLRCRHWLVTKPLVVDVSLRESTSRIEYDCEARYGVTDISCEAYDTLYTAGGLATPVVIIRDDLPLTNANLDRLGVRYEWYSPHNLQLWLTNGYWLLIPLLTGAFAVTLWSRLKSHATRRATVTALASVPVGIVLLFSTIYVMLSLHLVD